MVDLIRCKISVQYFAKTERIFQILLQEWSILVNAVDVLKVFHKATKDIQQVNYTLSDFFGSLIVLRERMLTFIQNMEESTDLPRCMYEQLMKRWSSVAQNPMMLCAIYLDRRFSSEMTDDEIALAKLTLLKIWERIKTSNNSEPELNDITENVRCEDDSNLLEYYFQKKGIDTTNTTHSTEKTDKPDYHVSNDQLLLMFNTFEKIGRIPMKTPILQFWETQKRNFPEIYVLSTVINAVAPSQSRTERDFSALGLIYNNRRQRLTLSILQDIIIIKLNSNLALKIFEKDMIELKNE